MQLYEWVGRGYASECMAEMWAEATATYRYGTGVGPDCSEWARGMEKRDYLGLKSFDKPNNNRLGRQDGKTKMDEVGGGGDD